MTFSFGVKVDPGGSHLLDQAGRPWFYLADTAWNLFHRLNRDEAEHFLLTRARQGFNALQIMVLAEQDGLNTPNRLGHRPLIDNDPTKLDPHYFGHIDELVARMNQLGMVAVLNPTWGDKLPDAGGAGPVIFDPDNAREYGRLLGERYRDAAVIWLNGGDRGIVNGTQRRIWCGIGEGLRETSSHLITFHPKGGASSGPDMHAELWLDFNSIQSGHGDWDFPIERMLRDDLARQPRKPVINAEPCYEDHPIMRYDPGDPSWKPTRGWFDELDVRDACYRSVFSGACGIGYGCHPVWQFADTSLRPVVNNARRHWRDAIELPGASQMRHLRALWDSDSGWRPVAREIAWDCPATIRASSGRQLAYVPADAAQDWIGQHLATLQKGNRSRWFDPRSGQYIQGEGIPDVMLDWVLETTPLP